MTQHQMPDFLSSHKIPASLMNARVARQDFIDGFMIPRGVCTLLATAGGSGKTMASLGAAVSSAAGLPFNFFGSRSYDRPLRTVFVSGEESRGMIARKIHHELGMADAYKKAEELGTIALLSWSDTPGIEGRLFGKEGSLSPHGADLFDALRSFKPDFIVFDTLRSLSEGDYQNDGIAASIIMHLNALAADTNAAIVMTAHINKGSEKIIPSSPSADLINLLSGSSALVNSARQAIVLIAAKKDAYSMIEKAQDDQVWMCTVKSNIGFFLANNVFPVIRSAAMKTFCSISSAGDMIMEQLDDRTKAIVQDLEDHLLCMIRLSAACLQPFHDRGKDSPDKLYGTLLAPVLPRGANEDLVKIAVDRLIRSEMVVIARGSSASGYLDVAGGPFANPELHLDDAGKAPKFRSGASVMSEWAAHIKPQVEEIRARRLG